MSTLEERRKNAAKVKRHYHRHRVRLRHEHQQRALREAAWKAPQSGDWAVAIIDGEPVVTAFEGLVGGLTAASARRITSALKRLLGTKPEPKKGTSILIVTKDGRVRKCVSLTEAGKLLGCHRSTVQRNLAGGGDCASCGGWTDDADFTDYAGSEVGVGGFDCTILRGCQCAPSI